ncbi:MAG TPA: excinuclease ABC subunit UvrA [Bacteroidales bacterium]|nr:MAG: excinuclease ABC subunit A [Bacteroidetes bacterium GWF2_33_38]OFY75312.1 MAG: excinuclease ABC subunit A [Bacteroidetes bacterium RIFOXYA12_FULL_33_9]OFY86238.1 MAG: excinuclease ABC subunit A [Bacteroidetes bacterium RIFOXYA2_FULL_33_7]HBF89243.1 excinuclease ABC subunit UvrA [Bacteroidales bacterium]
MNNLINHNFTTETAFVSEDENIQVIGAREHNLKNIDVIIPRNKLTVITGLSGSGKSSLAFDTIYAEGQRRYMETFSAYARQFLGNIERPDVDKISGLSPVISIEQKTTNKNPRSTVGTTTEIYDFIRLLYAKVSKAYSYATGEEMVKYTSEQIIELLYDKYLNKKIILLAPLVKGRKGHYRDLFENIRTKGYLYARVDGEIVDLSFGLKVDRYKAHDIEVVVDKLELKNDLHQRLKSSVQTAMNHGKGLMMVLDVDSNEAKYYSRHLMCPTTGISYEDPAPHSFSFNSPKGACPVCNGLGEVADIDFDKIIPDRNLSIFDGAIVPIGKHKNSVIFWQLEAIAEKYDFTLKTPVKDISEEALNIILHGSSESFRLKNTPLGESSNYFLSYNGVISYINKNLEETQSKSALTWANQFVVDIKCPECQGKRLKKEALNFKLLDKNISELSNLDISDLYNWFETLPEKLDKKQQEISKEIIKEILVRLKFLLNVGLEYLTINRSSRTLSGGESQRIRLATQIGSQLVNVLYILDEPSIGLHQKDNIKLIDSLKELRDAGNSVIVVEHDKETILSADYVVDIGPFAGRFGGKVSAIGTPQEILASNTLTAQYLNGVKKIPIPKKRREGSGKNISLIGATGNNLKNVNITIPLGTLTCITGVSGSGKSSLINSTLYPILSQKFYNSKKEPLKYESIDGIQFLDKVIEVDQSPIGRTPRSNPATYTGIFNDIRKIFELLPESKIRGYKQSRFSFNVKGGRCETCQGAGLKTIEMNFLPDVHVKCEECNGKRYNRETLEVRYKGKSINDVLNCTINQSYELFQNIPSIARKLKTIQDVGLGYITLGQASTTLSGGEAQRIKLATELAKKDTGNTIYILDEPTTGLHFDDIRVLLDVLNRLVDKGNTIIVIEHNMDVIKVADYIIDLGKDGGKNGGEILFSGKPEDLIQISNSYTATYLRNELNA